ncbi:type II toxin-antitoxin system VapC family toxin [Actinomycetospora cinnamomea]|uniref:Ribonuclease VapC n=1 Tax=Actinomycetospora cinnamomea TaxID=663609 RepID=A0A2U1FFR2_9PSEU|nr:type II toxin-antitoxin system VapC family toxin [Actinomycetospora cinnamomea]PVZ11034.1 ribonuclease VapC [Actinomycetospora cinnamomea]
MIVDTSAVVAVVLGEPDAERYAEALTRPGLRLLSAVNLVEAGIVVEARQGPDAARDLTLLLETTTVTVEPVDDAQARLAVDAWRRFGKGRHPAGLNLGDCFAYALAKAYGDPLLFTGNDFSQTDVASVL